jgi:hypothetical protein
VSARLSNAQKLDLLGMSFAAVISTGLIGAALIAPHGHEPRTAVEAQAVIAANTPSVTITPPMDTVAPLTPQIDDVPVEVRRAPAVAASRIVRTSSVRRDGAPAITTTTDAGRKPLARRLAGLLTGNGAYTVRPFPTVGRE